MYTGYNNTTNLIGKELEKANQKTLSQTEAIKDIFFTRAGIKLTPADVYIIYCEEFKKILLSSVRARMTSLTKKGYLVKTEIMRKGLYGAPEHCWELNSPTKQLDMFN